ncbi:hypothetical protein Tco_1397239 [Tanacetum coccineum]
MSLRITFGVRVSDEIGWNKALHINWKALVERENVGLDLIKYDLCPSVVEYLTTKGIGLCVVDSHTEYGGEPNVDLLRAFLNIGPAGDWLTLSNRGSSGIPKALTKPITHIEG